MAMPVANARAAGTLPMRSGKKGRQVLLIHRPKYRDWSLPKGHLDAGETFREAALRELVEETGISGEMGRLIGAVGYRVGRRRKVVRYYVLESERTRFVPNSEADEAVWLSPPKAMKLTTYERDRQVIARGMELVAEPRSTRIYLVRHAMAGRRSLWSGPDEARPLSGVGQRQTVAITNRLLERPVTRVLTSDFLRCDQTVRPLAGAVALRVRHHPALAEGADPGETFELMRTLRGHSAVLCSHGDIISGVIEKLAADGVDLGNTIEWKKGSVWELDLVKGQVIAGRYRPPP